jgi:hypothetical protein
MEEGDMSKAFSISRVKALLKIQKEKIQGALFNLAENGLHPRDECDLVWEKQKAMAVKGLKISRYVKGIDDLNDQIAALEKEKSRIAARGLKSILKRHPGIASDGPAVGHGRHNTNIQRFQNAITRHAEEYFKEAQRLALPKGSARQNLKDLLSNLEESMLLCEDMVEVHDLVDIIDRSIAIAKEE